MRPLAEFQRLGGGQPGLPLAPLVGVQDDVVGEVADRAQRTGVEQRRAGDRKELEVAPVPRPAVAPAPVAVVDAEVDLRVVDVGRIVGAGEMQADARKLLAEAAEPRPQPERQQGGHTAYRAVDRKSVGSGKGGTVGVDHGGGRKMTKKKT